MSEATPATSAAESSASTDLPKPVVDAEPQHATNEIATEEPVTTPAVQTSQASPVVEPVAKQDHDESPEPQSSLTKKFTEAEWSALKEFRAILPDVFADGYPDNPKAKDTPISIWGVTVDPHSPRDARVSVVLIKFLRARNLNVHEARDMLVSTLRWRESFNVEAAMKEEFPQNVFGQLGYNFGHDKAGRPVVYNVYGGNENSSVVFGDIQRFLRWRVALMEKSIARLDFMELDDMIQVHDYEGVSLRSRDANAKNAASEATNIFQSHYPEFLHKKFFINVPTILNWMFWMFKPLLSPKTFAKMEVVGTGQHAIKKTLSPIIDSDNLPKRYGGDAEAF